MKTGYISAAVAVAVLVLAPAASAHVTIQPEEVPAGGFTRMDVRVPTERDDASTTKVDVQFPPGFLSVSTEPVPGWDAKITMRKLDKPVEQFGEQVTEEVGRITFTGGSIGPGEFQDFGLSVGVPDKPGSTLTFKAIQTYSGGEVVRWIGPPDSEQPAPQVKLTAAEAAGDGSQAAAQQPQAPAGGDDDDSSNTLSIIALIVGIAGLAAGLAAL
ncbi:MAG TPA: YcnI family protein, partial [Thermoleophilaceae bacterium]|nr:YcnI family protein [Thermoleophilaceae bacterium]